MQIAPYEYISISQKGPYKIFRGLMLCNVLPLSYWEMNCSHVLDDWLRPLEGLLKAVARGCSRQLEGAG